MFKQNLPSPLVFWLPQNASPTSGLTGQTFASTDIQISKAGGAWANAVNVGSVNEIGQGLYSILLDATELNTLGPLVVKINKALAVPNRIYVDEVVPELPGVLVPEVYTGIVNSILASALVANTVTAILASSLATTIINGVVGSATLVNNIVAGVVASSLPAGVRDAILGAVHDGTATVGGTLRRLEALMTGRATGLKGALATFFRRDGATTLWTATQNVASGTRETGALTPGTE